MAESIDSLIQRTHDLESAGTIDKAFQVLAETGQEFPDNGDVWAELSRFFATYLDMDKAEESAKVALNLQCSNSATASQSLAYAVDRMHELGRYDLADLLGHLEKAYEKQKIPEVGATLCNVMRANNRIAEACEISEQMLALHPESRSTLINAAKTAFTSGDHQTAYDLIMRGFAIDPLATWWDMVSTFSNPLVAILRKTGKAQEMADYLDRQFSVTPLLNLVTPRCTPWHREHVSAIREERIAMGLESCLFVTMVKSGSVSVSAILNSGFGLVSAAYSLITEKVIPSWARDFNRGGACYVTHFEGNAENIAALKDAGITRAIVNVRDPRQGALSYAHHISRYETDQPQIWSADIHKKPLSERVDYSLETYYRSILTWITEWTEAANEIDITFTTFEEFRRDPDALTEKIINAYGGDRCHFNRDSAFSRNRNTDYHFRRGDIDEWREVFTPKQIEIANDLLPDSFVERFGWRR